jgi:hypothetical protein
MPMNPLLRQSTMVSSVALALHGLMAPPSPAAQSPASTPAPPPPPRIEVTYERLIDGNGHWKVQFRVANMGAGTLFTAPNQAVLGDIELRGKTNVFRVAGEATTPTLEPGRNHVVSVMVSESTMASLIGEEWRYTCRYGEDGLRTRISHWQWGTGGPGPRANKLIPKALKGMPLNIDGSSAWLPPPPVEIVDNGPRYMYMGPGREPELIDEPDVVLSTPPTAPTNSPSQPDTPRE